MITHMHRFVVKNMQVFCDKNAKNKLLLLLLLKNYQIYKTSGKSSRALVWAATNFAGTSVSNRCSLTSQQKSNAATVPGCYGYS